MFKCIFEWYFFVVIIVLFFLYSYFYEYLVKFYSFNVLLEKKKNKNL